MRDVVRLLGIVVALMYLGILAHESATGVAFIRNVATKLVAVYGMQPFAAHNFAAVIVIVVPLIALLSLSAFIKKE